MFYYLLHLPLIHVLALAAWRIRDGQVNTAWFATAPYVAVPAEQRWSLALLYLVFIVAVTLLYFVCRWYADIRKRSRSPIVRYI
jgi:hypothetical protein